MEVFALKPTLYFGAGALDVLGELAHGRVLIVTDAFLARKSGLLAGIQARLTGCEIEVFDRVKPDPSLALVAEGVAVLRAFRPDVLLAFGGGSPIDCAKGMRHFGVLEGAPRPKLFCVPTTAGTGSEVTSFAVLTDTARGVKYPLVDDALLPELAILDASLLAGVPASITADTGMDVLTHAAEAYVGGKSNAFTNPLAEQAFVLAYQNLPAAYTGDMVAKEQMLLASCLAGIAFNGAGLGVCHGLAHALGGRYHVAHGRLNGVLLPAVIRYNATEATAAGKYAHLAKRCGLPPNARALAAGLARLGLSLHMPQRLRECGLVAKVVQGDLAALTDAVLADVCTPGNPRPVSGAAVGALIKEVL